MELFREKVHRDLHDYLAANGMADARFPDCVDIEGKWRETAEAYLSDGIREFQAYPTVSLGWMMYLAMALTKFWDEDWTRYSEEKDLYVRLRDRRGYDYMDEYILEEVLKLKGEARKKTEDIVAECASRTLSKLRHERLEPGTPQAFHGYVDCLHELYLMGMAVQLRAMGYHMDKV